MSQHDTQDRIVQLLTNNPADPIEVPDRTQVLAIAVVAIAIIITFLAYLPGLSGPLLLDDLSQLQGLINESADDPATVLANYILSSSGPFGRPVAMATFVASAITHGPDIWWWKYENVMLHLINGLLVFWLTSLLFRMAVRSDGSQHWFAGAIAAAFWLLHPLQISTVLYTVQRMTELSALFVLAGLICYIKGRERQMTRNVRGWLLICVSFCVFFPLAVLAKESALLFPVLCSLVEIFVLKFEGHAAARSQVKLLHGAIGLGCLLAAAYVLVNFSTIVLDRYALRGFSFSERVYTELRVVVLYLSQLLLPVQSKMGFFHDDIPLSTSLVEPITTLFSGISIVALIGGAIIVRKRLPLFAFGVLFYFASHALESTIFPLELMFEHRNYLPSVGIVIAAIATVQALIRHRMGLAFIVIAGLCGFSFLTWQRASSWSSPSTMYQFMYYAHPESSRLNLVFANLYTEIGEYEEARRSLAKITPDLGPAVHGLFLDCIQNKQVYEDDVRNVASLNGGVVASHVTSSLEVLLQANVDGKCSVPKSALIALIDRLLILPIRSNRDQQSLQISKARLLESQDDVDGAVAALQAAYELRPDSSVPLYMAAHTLSLRNRLDEAAAYLSLAYEVERESRFRSVDVAKTVYLNIGRMYAAGDNLDRAMAVYSQAISSMPKEPRFYLEKAKLLIQQSRYDEAREALATLRFLDPGDISDHEYDIRRLERLLANTPVSAVSESALL